MDTLEVIRGWYRHTELSAEVMPCRYPFECAGSRAINVTVENMLSNRSTGNHSRSNTSIEVVVLTAGDALCSEEYSGPMCRS